MATIGNDWDDILRNEFQSEYWQRLEAFLTEEYEKKQIYPKRKDIFNALKATPYHKVRAVILGQDPYHGAGQAHGMCFSVQKGVRVPPSLMNVYKELQNEYGYPVPEHGYLQAWADEGVLLLNTILTVEACKPMSHQGQGWEKFTESIIKELSLRKEPMVFLLWGAPAQNKASLIDPARHLVLGSSHPSPLAAYRGFNGCGHFKLANEFLKEHGLGEIQWQIL